MSVKLKYFESGSNLAQVFVFFTLRAVDSKGRILMFDNTDSIVLQFKLQLMPEMLLEGLKHLCLAFHLYVYHLKNLLFLVTDLVELTDSEGLQRLIRNNRSSAGAHYFRGVCSLWDQQSSVHLSNLALHVVNE